MRQLFTKISQNVSFANGTTYWSAISGQNALSDTFGPAAAMAPLPWAATVRNLAIFKHVAIAQNITVTVLKNNVPTALTGVIPAGSTGPLLFSGIDVNFNQFDYISYRVVTATGFPFPGFNLGFCIEIESIGNVFGLTGFIAGSSVNSGGFGGALGNGQFGGWNTGVSNGILSGSYSICSSPGNVTTLVLSTFVAPLPGSSWIGLIRLNGINQDGSGGTVDTRCTITAGNLNGVSTFILPIDKGDHVDVAYYRTGTTGPFAFVEMTAGVGFIPTNADYFMLTGGTNASTVHEPLSYNWNTTDSSSPNTSISPIGLPKVIGRGLIVERSLAPGLGESFVHTIQRNGTPTSIQVTITDNNVVGLIADLFEEFESLGNITLETLSSSGVPITSQLHWGLEATIEGVGPQPPVNGSIIVQKVINNGSYPTEEFTIHAGGGLSPASFI